MTGITEQELAEDIQMLKRLELQGEKSAIADCKRIVQEGKILIKMKEKVGHGKWKTWAEKYLPFPYRTAARYMQVASKVPLAAHLFSLGKGVIFELIKLPDSTLKELTVNTVIKGKKLRDMECDEVGKAFSQKKPSERPRIYDFIKYQAAVKKNNPKLWSEVEDDLAALLGGKVLETLATRLKLKGKTRDERAREVINFLKAVMPLIDQIDDVPGKLSKGYKGEILQILIGGWRRGVHLPAYAVVPKTRKIAR